VHRRELQEKPVQGGGIVPTYKQEDDECEDTTRVAHHLRRVWGMHSQAGLRLCPDKEVLPEEHLGILMVAQQLLFQLVQGLVRHESARATRILAGQQPRTRRGQHDQESGHRRAQCVPAALRYLGAYSLGNQVCAGRAESALLRPDLRL